MYGKKCHCPPEQGCSNDMRIGKENSTSHQNKRIGQWGLSAKYRIFAITNPDETMNIQHARLIAAMVAYDHGDPRRIQHFMKVHDFAATIGALEHVDADTLWGLETAAIVHDIGIHVAEAKYGKCDGRLQEQEGPAEARKLLQQVGGYSEEQIQRVEFLIAHHHTYKNIEDIDYQILVEADFLVNIYEDQLSRQAILAIKEKVFKTPTGLRLLQDQFLSPR